MEEYRGEGDANNHSQQRRNKMQKINEVVSILLKTITCIGIGIMSYWLIDSSMNNHSTIILQQQNQAIQQFVSKLQALKNAEVDKILSGK